jgi:hypothetical protein
MGKLAWNIPNFPKEEGERRHRAIKEQMEFRGIDCLIIAGHEGNYGARTASFRYVSNYAMWFDDEYIVFPWREIRCSSPLIQPTMSGLRNSAGFPLRQEGFLACVTMFQISPQL